MDTKDSARGNAESFIADHHISYANVYDESGEIALRMGNLPVEALPFSVLVDRHGRIAAVYVGPQPPRDLQPALGVLLLET